MFGLGLLLLLVAVVMFYIWRLWLQLHGQAWKPSGKWERRTTAMHEHLATQPGMFESMTRSQKITMAVTMIATLSIYALFAAFVLTR